MSQHSSRQFAVGMSSREIKNPYAALETEIMKGSNFQCNVLRRIRWTNCTNSDNGDFYKKFTHLNMH